MFDYSRIVFYYMFGIWDESGDIHGDIETMGKNGRQGPTWEDPNQDVVRRN